MNAATASVLAAEARVTIARISSIAAVPAWQLQAERRLEIAAGTVLLVSAREVIEALISAGSLPTDEDGRWEIARPFAKAVEPLAAALETEGVRAASMGAGRARAEVRRQTGEIAVKASEGSARAGISFEIFDERVARLLKEHVFTASRATIDRLINGVMDRLGKAYERGLGIREAAEEIAASFEGLATWQLQRIARTEINSFQNLGAYEALLDGRIGWKQWWTAQDERVRDAHAVVHGEVVAATEPFSLGLMYPGDRAGPIALWINCRCTLLPSVLPTGVQT